MAIKNSVSNNFYLSLLIVLTFSIAAYPVRNVKEGNISRVITYVITGISEQFEEAVTLFR